MLKKEIVLEKRIVSHLDVYNSSCGLALLVGKTKLKELKGQVLKRLQDVYRSVKVLFVDEYSMLPQKALYYIDQRLKQIKGNTNVFGGIIVVFIGDIAQLPPVKAYSVWDTRTAGKSTNDVYGMFLFQTHFKTVISLKENNRIDGGDSDAIKFDEFLNGLADGKVTLAQWELIRDRCSHDTIGDEEWENCGFNSKDTTYL